MIYSVIEILKLKVLLVGDDKYLENVYLNPENGFLKEISQKYREDQKGSILKALNFFKNYSQKKIVTLPPLNLSSYTSKQLKVYNKLQTIEFGEIISYKKLAELSGLKNASRFVGTTMRINKFPIIIPCHRVITSSGAMGNYAAGPEIKRILLDFESEI
jgi:O-6-methylguanine DNA methyltransferase